MLEPEDRHPRASAGALRECARLAVAHPRRLARLVRAVVRARGARRAPGWLCVLAPLATLEPDVAHFEWESAAVTHGPVADVWGCPVVMSCHGGLQIQRAAPGDGLVTEGLPAAFARASAVQCVSELEREQAAELGMDPAKARLIPCGVDPEVFRPPPPGVRDTDTMHLVAVGWLRWMKGYEYALRTLRALLDAGVPARLDVFGGDPLPPMREAGDRERVLHTIADLGLADHVSLHGHVPSEELIAALQRAHALLHSSVSEGLPVVILEAMACGVPVVTTDCGGVREAVRDGVEGIVLPPREPRRAAEALARLWSEPELRERMGAAGRARVRERFSLESHLDAMEALYLGVARESAG